MTSVETANDAATTGEPASTSKGKANRARQRPTRAPRGRKGSPKPQLAKTAASKPSRGSGKPGRSGTKQEQLISMLRRPDGATIGEIVKAFGWQPHTVRGAISGALKKKLGLKVTSEKIGDRGRVYRIAD